MENVIKQGYLKKGNSTEGGVFSGIIEKMTPRKWYILVVRRGVPYLEQYERDVDIFSSPPTASYDLSPCTSISRTMATSARTFTFVIVCPNQLIELIASTREQMQDWCNALERTLSSLGVLKRDIEEHVYTFCPAVSNVVGHSQNKADQEDDNNEENDYVDEDLGAVGRAPPPLPPLAPRPQQPPPLPGGHPSLLRTNSKDPPRESGDAVTDPGPPAHPAPQPPPPRKGATAIAACSAVSPSSASRHPPLPPCPPPSLPPSPSVPSTPPPPLPPGRPPAPSAAPPPKPPPSLPRPPERPPPPCVNQQEKSLPPRPGRLPKPQKPGSVRTSGDNEDSDSSDTDYSSDFVSGAFWEINRKTPVPTARRATLMRKPPTGSSGGAESDGVGNPPPDRIEELDEGYTDLATVSHLRNSGNADLQEGKNHEYSEVKKKSTLASSVSLEKGREKTENSKQTMGNGLASGHTAQSNERDGDSARAGARVSGEGTNSAPGQEAGQVPDPSAENFYAPFPGDVDDTFASASSRPVTDGGDGEPESGVTVVKCPPSSNPQKNSTPPLASEDLESDSVYASAAEASSLPTNSVPPLPKRLDSLPSWKSDSVEEMPMNNTACAASNGSPVPDASPAEGDVTRPVPARRKNVYPVSSVNFTEKSSPAIPPLPPRRSTVINRGPSVDSGFGPPPLPTRKAQSFRSTRPSSSDEVDGEHAPDSPGTGEGKDEEAFSRPTSSVLRHGSIGGSDVTENHLRQRMRLDREHSVHSVVSLKQSQAEILRQEMELPGVTITVTVRAAQGIAFVDCADTVCVVGWIQKDFPSLHGKFHIGDQLISICNVKVTSAAMAHKMLKHPKPDMVEMLVKRIPHAVVLAIRREAEGQNIGIKRNGGTAEIQYVDPNGLAAGNGLPLHAPTVLEPDPAGRTTWVLTEINSRHLSLFFKDSEIEHRLNAVGREISVVVQPADYIGELKKQLKKMKNHKNYIVQ